MRIVTVCTENVCRSPGAAQLLRVQLAGVAGLSVVSAGVAAGRDGRLCPDMSELLGAQGGTSVQAPQHASRVLSRKLLDASDLVLTAQRSHRADVARLVPSANARTFTMRGAAGLASFVVGQVAAGMPGETDLVPGAPLLPPASEVDARLRWLVAEMNESRGLAPPFPGVSRSPFHVPRRRNAPCDLDVPDPHTASRVSHATTFDLLERAIGSLAESITRLLEV